MENNWNTLLLVDWFKLETNRFIIDRVSLDLNRTIAKLMFGFLGRGSNDGFNSMMMMMKTNWGKQLPFDHLWPSSHLFNEVVDDIDEEEDNQNKNKIR